MQILDTACRWNPRTHAKNLINECDKSNNIAIKTPVGITKRSEVKKCVAQGECLSPLKCTCTIDNIADKHIENLSEHLYLYKDSVPLPPLGMVDDQLCIANCGLDSVLANAHLNCLTNIKSLLLDQRNASRFMLAEKLIIALRH